MNAIPIIVGKKYEDKRFHMTVVVRAILSQHVEVKGDHPDPFKIPKVYFKEHFTLLD